MGHRPLGSVRGQPLATANRGRGHAAPRGGQPRGHVIPRRGHPRGHAMRGRGRNRDHVMPRRGRSRGHVMPRNAGHPLHQEDVRGLIIEKRKKTLCPRQADLLIVYVVYSECAYEFPTVSSKKRKLTSSLLLLQELS